MQFDKHSPEFPRGTDEAAVWAEKALFDRNDALGYALMSTNPKPPKFLGPLLVRRCEHERRTVC